MPTPLDIVQQHLGVPGSGHWDAVTDGALLAYQKTGKGPLHMDASGHPDPKTLANLGYYAPDEIFTKDWVDYLHGSPEPGTFGRDLRASIDQVPRWAWATVGVTFSLFAYMAYKTDKKRGK